MIEGKKENSSGSAFGPITVMIDASRLSHSVATALKDRPHGIPIQPNRSLPLRPPPALPTRNPLPQSSKNSPITQVTCSGNGDESASISDTSINRTNSKDHNKNEVPCHPEFVGINFYDSKDTEKSFNHKLGDLHRDIPEVSANSWHTNFLENEESDKTTSGIQRRKSLEYGAISRHGSSKIPRRDKVRGDSSVKKRTTSITEKNAAILKKENFMEVKNMEMVVPTIKPKILSATELRKELEKSTLISENPERIESCNFGLPIIHKYRKSKSNAQKFSKKNTISEEIVDLVEKTIRKETSSNTFASTKPHPPNIPKCPVAIPIEVAHAMQQGDPRNMYIVTPERNQSDSIKSNYNLETTKTSIPKTNEKIENRLPSMPILEDTQINTICNKKTLFKNQVNIYEETESNVTGELAPVMGEAKVLRVPANLSSESNSLAANEPIQGDTNPKDNHKFDEPRGRDSVANVSTVLQFKIPGHTPELIILSTPEVMSNGRVASFENSSPVEATIPVSLSNNIRSTVEKPDKNEDLTTKNVLNELKEFKKDDHQYYREEKTLQEEYHTETNSADQFPLSADCKQQCEDLQMRTENPDDLHDTQEEVKRSQIDELISKKSPEIRSEANERKVRLRKKKRNAELQKLFQEKVLLRYEMSQIDDRSELKVLEQKINLVEKQIENTQKQIEKLISIENPGSCAKSPPLMIQVRRDLVPKVPSPEFMEPDSQSPLRPTNETDKASIGRNPPVSPLTLLARDSDSLPEEPDVEDETRSGMVEPDFASTAEIKSEIKSIPENNRKISYTDRNPLPINDGKADNASNQSTIQDVNIRSAPLNENPKMTNNNFEKLNKNLSSVSGDVFPSVDKPLKTIRPLVPYPENYVPSNLNGVVNQKSPNKQYTTDNLSLRRDTVDKEQRKPNYDCSPCPRSNSAMAVNNTAHFDTHNVNPSTVNDLFTPDTTRQIARQGNTNFQPVPNYPIHSSEYSTPAKVPSTFCKDNGGAIINLSSPLQGQPALFLPPPYYRNLTAQEYPILAEPSQNNQTTQCLSQYPVTQSSKPFTPDQDPSLHSSILAAHLSMPQTEDPAKISDSTKLPSLDKSKEVAQSNPPKHIGNHIITEQFPTLGNWATQMIKESVARQRIDNPTTAPINSHPTIAYGTVNKTAGSGIYKMVTAAVDAKNLAPATNTIHWHPATIWSEQQRPSQGFPTAQRNNSHPYQRDHAVNSQIIRSSHNTPTAYLGPGVFLSGNLHHQVPSRPQTIPTTEESGSQLSRNHQNPRLYHPPTSSIPSSVPGVYQNQGNVAHLVNSIVMTPQQYQQRPQSYVQAMYPQWHLVNKYHQNYVSPQLKGYKIQPKPIKRSTDCRTMNTNLAPTQQPCDNPLNQLMQNVPSLKFPIPTYNMPVALHTGIQGGINEPLDVGQSSTAPHLGKVHKNPVDRSNTLKCSLCGVNGPKYTCLGCETVFYCDKNCQVKHWRIHSIECPKKMPKLKKVS